MELQNILRPYLLRRVKSDVEKDLPRKTETVIDVELTALQKRYYRAIIEKNRKILSGKRASKVNFHLRIYSSGATCDNAYLLVFVFVNDLEFCRALHSV